MLNIRPKWVKRIPRTAAVRKITVVPADNSQFT